MKGLHKITWILVIIGGLNWLVLALFNWDISAVLGGMNSTLSKIVYILVGLSALIELFSHKSTCRACSTDGPKPMSSNPSMPNNM
jgi:uncharacterized membrane protein YuzA (DUF378 family)